MFLIRENSCNPWTRVVLKSCNPWTRSTPERDFTYIDDIIDGVEAAIDRVDGFEIINLGESQTITVDRLIDLIETNLASRPKD